jgi:hypothetical protein
MIEGDEEGTQGPKGPQAANVKVQDTFNIGLNDKVFFQHFQVP